MGGGGGRAPDFGRSGRTNNEGSAVVLRMMGVKQAIGDGGGSWWQRVDKMGDVTK